MPRRLRLSYSLIAFFSSAFLAFGLYNVHHLTDITEGGVLGMTLFLDHWFGISPALSGSLLNLACYALGWKLLGGSFIAYSLIATAGFSIAYGIFEQFPPLWPQLIQHPFSAAILGALFVGIGAGLCVKIGGAPGGDDALAMSLSHITHIPIQWVYLLTDVTVLALSASYILLSRLAYSALTVLLSGQIIGWVQKLPWPKNQDT